MVSPTRHLSLHSRRKFLNYGVDPFTSKSDQLQISPGASPALLHHTVWRTWLFIANSDERWLYYQFSLPDLYISLQKVGKMYFLNSGVKRTSQQCTRTAQWEVLERRGSSPDHFWATKRWRDVLLPDDLWFSLRFFKNALPAMWGTHISKTPFRGPRRTIRYANYWKIKITTMNNKCYIANV